MAASRETLGESSLASGERRTSRARDVLRRPWGGRTRPSAARRALACGTGSGSRSLSTGRRIWCSPAYGTCASDSIPHPLRMVIPPACSRASASNADFPTPGSPRRTSTSSDPRVRPPAGLRCVNAPRLCRTARHQDRSQHRLIWRESPAGARPRYDHVPPRGSTGTPRERASRWPIPRPSRRTSSRSAGRDFRLLDAERREHAGLVSSRGCSGLTA
jgi:hypothetical protein